jgi:hypothetical protein
MDLKRMLNNVETEAALLKPQRVLLTLLSLPFFVLGAVIGFIVRFAWFTFSWCWTAIVVGYREARSTRKET